MIVLRTGSLTPTGERVEMVSMKLDLTERASQCQVTVAGGTALAVGTWLKSRSGPAKGVVWRIKTVDDSRIGSGQWSFTAEHIVQTLKDQVMFGEVNSKTLGGNDKTVSASNAMRFILSKSDYWTFGGCAYSTSNPYAFNGENLFSALETIAGSLEDSYFDYDLTTYPFKFYIRQLSSEVDSEMRVSRNITGPVKKTIDRSGMYTRIYPIGKNNLTLPEKYLSRNVGTWGLVEHVETDQSMDTVEKLRAWGNSRLADHCVPVITFTVPGLQMRDRTGESLDQIRINRVCRMPLPEYGTTVREKVTKISWADCVKEPDVCTVTLCNQQTDVASIIRQIASSSGKSARTHAKNGQEDHAWIEDTNDHVYLVAEAIIGRDANGVDWRRISELGTDANGIHGTVARMEGDVKTCESRLDMNEDSISLVVEGKGKDGKIKAASIVTSINNAGSNICITADHIRLDGSTRLNNVLTIADGMARFNRPVAFGVNAGQRASISLGIVSAPQFHWDGNAANQYYCKAEDFGKMIKTAEIVSNSLKLTKWNGDVLTFSKATTLSSAWSGGVITVTASPQGTTLQESLIQKSASWAANKKSATIPIHTTWGSSGQYESDTGWSVYIDASTAYNEGAARALDSISEAYTTAPNGATYDGNTNNSDGYFHSGSGRGKTVGIVVKAELKDGGTVLKTLYNDLISAPTNIYKYGWDSAAGVIEMPPTISGSTTKSYFDFTYPTSSGTNTIRFTLSKDSGGAYLKLGTALKLIVT